MNYSKFDRKECTLQYFLYKYVIGAWEFNKETGLVDVYGDFHIKNANSYSDSDASLFMSLINKDLFGVVTGDFIIERLPCEIEKLKGMPKEVRGSFIINYSTIINLEGSPKKIGKDLKLYDSAIENLKGCPQIIGGSLILRNVTKIRSLDGCPQEINGDFKLDCRSENHKIISLVGGPKIVKGSFSFERTGVTSLVGGPVEVGGHYGCDRNNLLKSLEGAPEKVSSFDCHFTEIESLINSPKEVNGNFNCSYTKLTSLVGAPEEVGGNFYCDNNRKLKSLVGAPKKVGGDFKCYDTLIESLEGAPQEVGGDFECHDNKRLSSLEGIPSIIGGVFEANKWNDNINDEEKKRISLLDKLGKIISGHNVSIYIGLCLIKNKIKGREFSMLCKSMGYKIEDSHVKMTARIERFL